MIARKKTCNCCGRKLWKKEFYKDRGVCKDCRREYSNRRYAATRKKPGGVHLSSKGKPVVYNGKGTQLFWGEQKIADFKRLFPYTDNESLVVKFDVSVSTLYRMARKLGIKKDEGYLSASRKRSAKIGGMRKSIRISREKLREQ